MTAYSFEQCDCDCHRFPEGAVMHCMPCCIKCPECGMHVRLSYFDDHIKRHEEERAVLEELMREEDKPRVTISVGDEKLSK